MTNHDETQTELRLSLWSSTVTREEMEAWLTEIALRVARETWEKQAVCLGAELVAAESALAAERAAHAETRRAWAEMHSAFERARSETDAAGSALASERAAHEETKAGLDAAKRDYEGACHLVAKMHHAATGATQGPVQGVVEDVADVRERLAAAEECLREIDGKIGHFADMEVPDFPLAMIPLAARIARTALGRTKNGL